MERIFEIDNDVPFTDIVTLAISENKLIYLYLFTVFPSIFIFHIPLNTLSLLLLIIGMGRTCSNG